jgi:hypothetical protein
MGRKTKMAIRNKLDIVETITAETMKANPIKSAKIIGVKDVETTYGKKPVLMFENGNEKNSVFINQFSMTNLIEAFGQDDSKWTGKQIKISVKDKCKASRDKDYIFVEKL